MSLSNAFYVLYSMCISLVSVIFHAVNRALNGFFKLVLWASIVIETCFLVVQLLIFMTIDIIFDLLWTLLTFHKSDIDPMKRLQAGKELIKKQLKYLK